MPAIRTATLAAATETAAALGATLTLDEVEALAAARGVTRKADVLTAVAEHVAAREKRVTRADLTLSQRRALLRLAAVPAGEAETPTSGFRALPLRRLAEAGLAERVEVQGDAEHGAYVATDAGRERAAEINPKWRTWTPGDGASSAESAPTAPVAEASA